MLEKPNLSVNKIITCLQNEYDLTVEQVTFLPLGADFDTAVYRVITEDGTPYFLKLRAGIFDEASVAYPKFLSDQGLLQIIPPIATQTGQLWGSLDKFKSILYPFVEGHNGYEIRLSDQHWHEFATTLKHMHMADVPLAITRQIQRETYSPRWRESVKRFLTRIERNDFDGPVLNDPIAQQLAAFLQSKSAQILDLIDRAHRYAQELQDQPHPFIVCHADIHAGNVLIDVNDAFYIVDWDTLKLAPKERDLMYIGGALMGGMRTAQVEEILFYAGYGQTEIDPTALAYYRFERIIEDLAEYCKLLLLAPEGGEDRARSLQAVKSNFRPNSTIEMAYRAVQT